MTYFKPMKPPSGVLEDDQLKNLKFPLLGSPKIDGFRLTVQEGRLLTSTLKDLPNPYIRQRLSNPAFNLLDGEGTSGDPQDGLTCFNCTTSLFRGSAMPTDDQPVTWWVFDKYDSIRGYTARAESAVHQLQSIAGLELPSWLRVRWLPFVVLRDLSEFLAYEDKCLSEGYEGMMSRQPWGTYKQGRSTHTAQELVRRKPTVEGEAVILRVIEGETNTNPQVENALGHMKRSSVQAGKVLNGTLGSYEVRGLTAYEGMKFNITAFGTEEENAVRWAERASLPGQLIRFKYQRYGSLEKARQPIGLGMRPWWDMSIL